MDEDEIRDEEEQEQEKYCFSCDEAITKENPNVACRFDELGEKKYEFFIYHLDHIDMREDESTFTDGTPHTCEKCWDNAEYQYLEKYFSKLDKNHTLDTLITWGERTLDIDIEKQDSKQAITEILSRMLKNKFPTLIIAKFLSLLRKIGIKDIKS